MSIDKRDTIVSVVIPVYNESGHITDCLESLTNQDYEPVEIILVDDGSSDDSVSKIRDFMKTKKVKNMALYTQPHNGPGVSRNFGAAKARGKILVFVDSDMTFNNNFLSFLVKPIVGGKSIGTDTQNEYLANTKNYWSRCWNLGRYFAAGVKTRNYLRSMIPNRKDHGGIFRAVLKSEFIKVNGFETSGDYTDDESLSKRLNAHPLLVRGATLYHFNPDTLIEVWKRASWIGSGKNFTRNNKQKMINSIKFFPALSLIKGLIIGLQYNYIQFIIFKVIYDTAIWFSIIKRTFI